MPQIGYGTYQTPPRMTEKCVANAIKIGYRSIDTAQCYGNEKEVGLACRKSGVARNELFITTKLWACHGYQDTLRSIDSSLKKLDVDFIDLLLIHEPRTFGNFTQNERSAKSYTNGKIIDKRDTVERNFIFYVPRIYGAAAPTVLQYGGHNHCR